MSYKKLRPVSVLTLAIYVFFLINPILAVGAETANYQPLGTNLSISPALPDGEDGWYKTPPTVTLAPNTGVASTYYKWDYQEFVEGNEAAHVPEGNNDLYYFSIDSSIGQKEAVKVVPLKHDGETPTGSITIDNGNPYTKLQTVTLTLSAKDNIAVTGMKVANTAQELEGLKKHDFDTFQTTMDWSLPAGQGQKYVYVRYTDIAGNQSDIYRDDITLDTEAPVVNGVENTKLYNLDVFPEFTEGTATLNQTEFVSGTRIHDDGHYDLLVTDEAQNKTEVKFSIDQTPPSVTGVENGKAYGAAVTPTITDVSGIASSILDGAAYTPGTPISSEGNHTLDVTDLAGNPTTISFAIDTSPPVVSGVENGKLYKESVTPIFAEPKAWLNDIPFTSGTEITADNNYILVVQDQAGNTTTVSFGIDQTPPDVKGIVHGGIYNYAVSPTFTEGSAVLTDKAALTDAQYLSGTSISDGNYLLTVMDSAGNQTSIEFSVDTKYPEISGVVDGGIYNQFVNPSFDEGTALLDDGAFSSGAEINTDGEHTLVVTDPAGNQTSVTFIIDTKYPVINGVENGKTYSSVEPTWDEGTAVVGQVIIPEHTVFDQEGEYILSVTDRAGNTSQVWFIIDRTAPIISGVQSKSYNTQVTVSWNEGTGVLNNISLPVETNSIILSEAGGYDLVVTDAAGNYSSVSFRIDYTPPAVTGVEQGRIYNSDVKPVFTEGTATLDGENFASGDIISTEGTHTLVVTDDANNMISIAFSIDKTAPAGTISINNGAEYTKTTNLILELSASDNGGSGVIQVMFANEPTFSGAQWEDYQAAREWPVTEEGPKTVYAKFKDAAGMISEVVSDSIILDNSFPTGAISINNGAEGTTSANVTLKLSAADTGTSVAEMLVSEDPAFNGAAWESFAADKVWTLSAGDGAKTVYVKYKDMAGNESQAYSDTINLMSNQLSGFSVYPNPIKLGSTAYIYYTLAQKANVTVSVYKADGELVRTLLANVSRTPSSYTQTWDGKGSNGSLVPDGNYKIVVEAKDSTGALIGQVETTLIAAAVPVLANISDMPDPFNPAANEKTKINYTISNNAVVTVSILNGYTVIKTFADTQAKPAGAYSIEWDGKDTTGNLVGDATYTYQIDAVNPLVPAFKSTVKYTTAVEKENPWISELSVSPSPLKIGSNTLSTSFNLNEAAKVTLKIVDANDSSNVLRTVLNGVSKNAGYNRITWDGKKDDGITYIPEGDYKVMLSAIDNFNKQSLIYEQPFKAGTVPTLTDIAVPLPFNPGIDEKATISYNLSQKAKVSIQIMQGYSVIRTLLPDLAVDPGAASVVQNPGLNSVEWDGKDDSGKIVGDDTFSYKIVATSTVVDTFTTTYKGNVIVEKGAPAISDVSAYPNPLKLGSANMSISYTLSEDAKVTVQILNGSQIVKEIEPNTQVNGGFNSVSWNGRDDLGKLFPEGTYSVVVKAADNAGNVSLSNPVDFKAGYVATVTADSTNPASFEGVNPVTLKYALSNDAIVNIQIFQGYTLVRKLTPEPLAVSMGLNSFTWDGKDEAGNTVADGVYKYQIDTVSPTVAAFTNTFKADIIVEGKIPEISNFTVPDTFKLAGSSLNIQYSLSENAQVTLEILDALGLPVKTLGNGQKSAGFNTVLWDGKNGENQYVSEGTYTVNIKAVDGAGKWCEQTKTFKAGYLPKVTALDVTPTPFSPAVDSQATVNYVLDHDANVTIQIMKGYIPVKTLITDQFRPAGANYEPWDGKDDSGNTVGDGEYTIQITSVSPTVNTFSSISKGLAVVETGAPTVSELFVGPDPVNFSSYSLQVSYTLSEASKVTVKVFDSNRQVVKTLVNGQSKNAGYNSNTWNGRTDPDNSLVPEGIYTLEVTAVDAFGKSVTQTDTFTVGYTPKATNITVSGLTIGYDLSANAVVTLEILNGYSVVRTLGYEQLAGNQTVIWDGNDQAGSALANGTYTLRITSVSPTVDTFRSTTTSTFTLAR